MEQMLKMNAQGMYYFETVYEDGEVPPELVENEELPDEDDVSEVILDIKQQPK